MRRKITLDLDTPATWPDDAVLAVLLGARDDLFASARGKRSAALSNAGRANPKPCPHGCGESFSGRAYRQHVPRCPKRTASSS